MTEDEWIHSHPEQCVSYLKSWQEKQKREDCRIANTQLIIASGAGMKIGGRKPTLNDFLPDYAKPKKRKRPPEEVEADLKAAFRKLANHTKKPDGQS
jgi:hypothetical protein